MYYRITILGCLLILFFSGCKKKEGTSIIPSNILEQDSMVVILTDIHLTEARIKQLKKKKGSQLLQADFNMMYEIPFESHHITRKQFEESLACYTINPELLEKIYEKVLTSLEERKIELEKLQSPADSLNKEGN